MSVCADGMANSVGSDQLCLVWVYRVCSGVYLNGQIFRVNAVNVSNFVLPKFLTKWHMQKNAKSAHPDQGQSSTEYFKE